MTDSVYISCRATVVLFLMTDCSICPVVLAALLQTSLFFCRLYCMLSVTNSYNYCLSLISLQTITFYFLLFLCHCQQLAAEGILFWGFPSVIVY